MNLPDVNILIYAHREDQEHHVYFAERLREALQSGTPLGLTPAVTSGFLRVTTHPKFPNGPTPLPVALAFVETLMALPQCIWVSPGRNHGTLFLDLCRKTNTTGKRVADAHHAVTAIEHAATWISRDTDFNRFTAHGLRFEHWEPLS